MFYYLAKKKKRIYKPLYPFTAVVVPQSSCLQRFYLQKRSCHYLVVHQVCDQSWLKQCDALLRNVFPSCWSYHIFEWILISPWLLLHWNFCSPEDLWFSIGMFFFSVLIFSSLNHIAKASCSFRLNFIRLRFVFNQFCWGLAQDKIKWVFHFALWFFDQ